MLMGGDFNLEKANYTYGSIDQMIHFINTHHGDKYNLFYSTPSKYLEAVQKMDKQWPVKYDDMLPYSDDSHAYWTGFYTSRPNKKSEAKKGTSLMHANNNIFS